MLLEKNYSLKTELGFVLLIIGMPLGTSIRNIFPSLEVVNLIMMLSILMIIDYRNLIRFNFPSINNHFWGISLLLLIFLIYASIANNHFFDQYQYYLLAILFALSTQDRYLEIKHFFPILFGASVVVSLVVLSQSSIGSFQLVQATEHTGDRLVLKEGGDPITTARALLVGFLAVIFYKPKQKWVNSLRLLVLISTIIGLLSFFTRTVIFALLAIVVAYIWNIGEIKTIKGISDTKKVIIYTLLFIIGVVLLYINLEFFANKVDSLIDKSYRGILSMFGNATANDFDASGAGRAEMREKIFDYISTHYSFLRLIGGYGFLKIFADSPIIQAYFDLGILFGSLYVFYTMYIPIKSNTKRTKTNNFLLFFKLLSIQYFFDQLTCGWPYFYMNLVPAIMLLFILRNKQDQNLKLVLEKLRTNYLLQLSNGRKNLG